ncbi:MAG TPA: hypothetical protein VEC38_06425 [Candidatus Binataceae bacterium]|nr:hypothetical protein [Candidatus Binataceae bacterium]
MELGAASKFALGAAAALLIAGCAALGGTSQTPVETTSDQTLEYYPFQVKGYQNSYPNRSVLVLTPKDERDFSESGTDNHSPRDGKPAVGIVTNQAGNVIQRVYSDPLPAIVQNAIAKSAEEAGMTPRTAPESDYHPAPKEADDYVVVSKITRGWVRKHRAADGQFGPRWITEAKFGLDVVVYKPPFTVPFWQGASNSSYVDPPVGSFGLGPEDEAGIYDEPGQVLSVALTRAVAGIFDRPELRTLVMGDEIRPR